jgi:hypothetical protein
MAFSFSELDIGLIIEHLFYNFNTLSRTALEKRNSVSERPAR